MTLPMWVSEKWTMRILITSRQTMLWINNDWESLIRNSIVGGNAGRWGCAPLYFITCNWYHVISILKSCVQCTKIIIKDCEVWCRRKRPPDAIYKKKLVFCGLEKDNQVFVVSWIQSYKSFIQNAHLESVYLWHYVFFPIIICPTLDSPITASLTYIETCIASHFHYLCFRSRS